ncbi:MAG: YciI family protein [Rhodospirillaceae bacterium]
MLFVIHGLDKPGPDIRTRLIETHREFLKTCGLDIKSSGPLTDDTGETMIGSLIIAEAESRAEIDAFLAAEPMAKAGLYETLTVTRWYQRVGSFAET